MFTEDALRQILPALPPDKRRDYAPLLQSAAAEFGINNPLRAAAFLAQIAHESMGLTRLVENLNYSAPRLRQVWPRRFPTDAVANAFARQPEKLANSVYANRNGNGPPESGDGFRYRGRGFIQLTGRANYREFGRLLGADLEGNPDLAAEPSVAFRVAAAFFKSRGCNELADQQAITVMTKRINGGTVGINERIALFGKAKRVFQAAGATRGATRGAAQSADEGRDVPATLSRGIMPGEEFAAAERGAKKSAKKGTAKKAAKKAAAKKAAAKKAAAKKPSATKGAPKKAAKKAVKKAGVKKSTGKAAAKKGGAKKGAARKGAAKKGGAKKGARARR